MDFARSFRDREGERTREQNLSEEEIAKKIEAKRGMEDAEGKFCKLTNGRKVSSVMAEVAQSYELRILITVIRLAKKNGNKLFKVTVWQHDGFSMYIERNSEKVCEMIQETVRKELGGLEIQTKLEFKRNNKEGIDGSKIEKKKARRYKKKGRNRKGSPFVSHYNNITERNIMQKEKPSPNIDALIQVDINKSEEKAGNEIPSSLELSHGNPMAYSPIMKHVDDSKGLITERRVDTAEWKLTA